MKKTLGERVKRLRKKQDLSQVQLAVKAGVTPLTIVRMESDMAPHRETTLRCVAGALGVTYDELVGK